ncbi:hypothetical protein E5Q_01256 [Mixia osmundae IAM 14324]|uniref:ATP synthase subunit delta, mitochondrial n=1 Tax=Mixia osmundae (strain CBS 9802 / IAM 14324 / JCM 22182 / KY 12970) TaxID=764103 RepID=G7DVJ4_MIXOS|nr:hypothetical protein E5Q_01256 [Mixia osmundae IAM 14324]
MIGPVMRNGLATASRRATVAPSTVLRRQPLLRRGYAEAASDKLRLSLVLPHEVIFESQEVLQVNLAAQSGDMGILANHVPSIESLKPGVVEVIEQNGQEAKKWFVSGGFANIHPSNLLTINAVEAYPLDQFSAEVCFCLQSAPASVKLKRSQAETDLQKKKQKRMQRSKSLKRSSLLSVHAKLSARVKSFTIFECIDALPCDLYAYLVSE